MGDNTAGNVSQIEAKSRNKRTKFVELAERRTVNAIRSIRIIGKLGNPNAYEYDESDVKKIVATLTKEVDALRQMMAKRGGKDSIEFKL